MRKTRRALGIILTLIGFGDFISYQILHDVFGGAAHHVEDGRYYLWSRYTLPPRVPQPGGTYTEVSRFTFYWLLWQDRSTFIAIALGMLGLWILNREKKFGD